MAVGSPDTVAGFEGDARKVTNVMPTVYMLIIMMTILGVFFLITAQPRNTQPGDPA
jgi:hypothetical protein